MRITKEKMNMPSSNKRVLNALEVNLNPLLSLMNRNDVTDIIYNPNGTIFAHLLDGRKEKQDINLDPNKVAAVAKLLAAGTQNDLNDDNPSVAAVWPDPPYRIQILLSPALRSPGLVIRRFPQRIIPLDEQVKNGVCTEEQANLIREMIMLKKNIIISGETGSGKTTFLNSIIAEIDPSERLYVIEDTRELMIKHENVWQVLCGDKVTASDALKIALRAKPDRIIVGEVRDGAALDMLEAWNTGHPGGLCSIHANSTSMIKRRIASLVRRVSLDSQMDLIDSTIDVGIQIALCPDGKRRIVEIEDYKKSNIL